jgi:hypothetical protein
MYFGVAGGGDELEVEWFKWETRLDGVVARLKRVFEEGNAEVLIRLRGGSGSVEQASSECLDDACVVNRGQYAVARRSEWVRFPVVGNGMMPFSTVDSEVMENKGGSTIIASESLRVSFDAVDAVTLARETVHVGDDR